MRLDPRRWPRGPRAAAAGIVPPGLVTLIASVPSETSTTAAALGYVLAVVFAAITGGVTAGLAASVISFLALNFFFTPPFETLAVEKTEDLVALAVFLAVSATVGTLVSRGRGRPRRPPPARRRRGPPARSVASERPACCITSEPG